MKNLDLVEFPKSAFTALGSVNKAAILYYIAATVRKYHWRKGRGSSDFMLGSISYSLPWLSPDDVKRELIEMSDSGFIEYKVVTNEDGSEHGGLTINGSGWKAVGMSEDGGSK